MLTTGTPRTKRSVTLSNSGVAIKLVTTPVGLLGMYLLPWQGQGHPSKQRRLRVSWLSLSWGIVMTTNPNWNFKVTRLPLVFGKLKSISLSM